MPKPPPYLFVYGSLMRNGDPQARKALDRNGHFLMAGSIQGRLYVAEGWPAAVPSADPQDRVHGEVFELADPDSVLASLDDWEGPRYQRRLLPVLFKDQGFEVESWAWLWTGPVDEAQRLPKGRWQPPKKDR